MRVGPWSDTGTYLASRHLSQAPVGPRPGGGISSEDPTSSVGNIVRIGICGALLLVWNMPINLDDYYLTTSRTGDRPERWGWEILRKSKPLGIRMTADGFQSNSAAQFAGQKALANFLSDLIKEDRRLPRK